ncbi:MAG: FAD-dependent oxidoreductase [Litoreibacter sp.]
MKKLVLIGGGHSHALVLNDLRKSPMDDVEITVINPGRSAPYSGMLPGFVAGHYTRDQLDIDLDLLTKSVGARLIDGKACALDADERSVVLDDGQKLSFDAASFDVGITSRMAQLEGFEEYATPAKPLGGFADRWEVFLNRARNPRIVVIGGGVAGAELAMAMAHAFATKKSTATVHLLDRGEALSALSAPARKKIQNSLKRWGVVVRSHVNIAAVKNDAIELSDGEAIGADFIVGAAGATPHPWIQDTGLELHDGYIRVDANLVSSMDGVFAVGDCAHMLQNPRPKAGVYAVRQAPILLENIRSYLSGEELKPYVPQSDYLKLVSLGGQRALGEKFGLVFSGNLAWRLKNRIDQQFMDQFKSS